MDNTSLDHTTLEHVPHELLHAKRRTNRFLTLLFILIIVGAFGAFWYYKKEYILSHTSGLIPVHAVPQSTEQTDTVPADTTNAL